MREEKNSLGESLREVGEELVLVLCVKLSRRFESLVGRESHIGSELWSAKVKVSDGEREKPRKAVRLTIMRDLSPLFSY